MNGAGGNSTRLMFDDDDDFNNSTPLSSIMYSVATLCIVLLVFKVIYERWVTPLSQVPGKYIHAISSLPMRYHMLRGTLPSFLLSLHRQYGPVVRIAPQRVSVADVEMLRHVLGSHVYRKTPSYDMPSVLEANTFSTRSAEQSAERRRQMGPGFSHKHLLEMEDRIRECGVERLREVLEDGVRRDGVARMQYNRVFSLIALDVIGVLGFGRRFEALRKGGHEMVGLLVRVRMFNYVTMAFPWFKKLPLLVGRRLGTLYRLIDFAVRAIEERRGEGKGVVDLLQMMMDVGRAEGDRRTTMSDAQMVSETILHLIAGVDTTSAGLTWTLALLLEHPEVMRRLVAEIRSEFPDLQSVVSFEDCRLRLPYLTAVINESLRIMSPTPGMLPRLAPAGGVRLGGYFLPAGTWICCSIGAVHLNPATFKSPCLFDPERFLGDRGLEIKHNLLAFSTGVRACLGRNLALVEMHVVLANLLKNYDLKTDGSAPKVSASAASAEEVLAGIPRHYMMTINPTNPDRDCQVLVYPRKPEAAVAG
ncbi:hypothetical protein LPJ56_000353 [Coemansia sp. RSA 2599]|nr:hypothetical protein LPJ75_000133 [Coemansia sp. RSA 2598]KAJ1829411.1 hypothetical protein LPJ56_000353 [Coemansia sp. RSA 2599]